MRVPVRAVIVWLVLAARLRRAGSGEHEQQHGCDQPEKGHSKNKSIKPRNVPQLFSSLYFFHVY
jgi:hypothetical protein